MNTQQEAINLLNEYASLLDDLVKIGQIKQALQSGDSDSDILVHRATHIREVAVALNEMPR